MRTKYTPLIRFVAPMNLTTSIQCSFTTPLPASGGIPVWICSVASPKISLDLTFGFNIWIRAVANRVNWSEERGLLNPIFQRNLISPRLCLYND